MAEFRNLCSHVQCADPSLTLSERLRLMLARDPSQLAILGSLTFYQSVFTLYTGTCHVFKKPNSRPTLHLNLSCFDWSELSILGSLTLCQSVFTFAKTCFPKTKLGKQSVSPASASLYWKLHVLSK